MAHLSSQHKGLCQGLVDDLELLMPGKFDLQKHRPGEGEECFRFIILQLVQQAAAESTLALEFAILCQEVKARYQPAPNSSFVSTSSSKKKATNEKSINPFVYLLTNQCQLFFNAIRNNPSVYTSYDDYVKRDEELQAEKNPEVAKQLQHAQRGRMNLRKLAIGHITYFGQLFNVGFINVCVMELCLKNLVSYCESPNELDIECFCVLMKTVGKNLSEAPKGKEIIDKFFNVLENIVDKQADSLEYKIRCLIFDVFQLYEANWQAVQVEVPKMKVKEVADKIEVARQNREFLAGIDGALENVTAEGLLDFMFNFKDELDSVDRLEGAIKVIFERAITSKHTSMFAVICKGLADVKANDASGEVTTFKQILLQKVRKEIDVVRQKAENFRSLMTRLGNLKVENEKSKLDKLRAEVEEDFKIASRAAAVATFIGELFNANFIESRFIFDEVFIILVNPKVISDASIEFFCNVLKVSGVKMMTEKNRDILIKDTFTRLFAEMEKITIFPKTKFKVEEIINFTRYQLKIPVKSFLDDIVRKPFNFHWGTKLIPKAKSPAEIRAKRNPVSNANEVNVKKIEAKVPELSTVDFSRPPPAVVSPYAIHNNIYEVIKQVPKRLYLKGISPTTVKYDANNNVPFKPVPIDFSQNFIDPTMMSGPRPNFPQN